MAFLNGAAAFVVDIAVQAGQRIDIERQGKIVVSRWFLTDFDTTETQFKQFPLMDKNTANRSAFSSEAKRIAERYGGKQSEIEQKLYKAMNDRGTLAFVTSKEAMPGISALAKSGPLAAMVGSIVLFWWFVMLVFQGEDAVKKIRAAVGQIEPGRGPAGETIRDTYRAKPAWAEVPRACV